ncbi:hypothetical protein CC78DRAFT_585439 [Lojkania enalia]|uniref:Uncharacterized protein n=1 Tax=Lojkania enalia TaxID=147567 RepID=A0A9P4K1V6_9PLEO|nr:hypothetical protein CC78DRAFT_585439 [Didymosphaeria enalia]
MDFSSSVFQPSTKPALSNDTMDHAKMIMACRFGWSAGPDSGGLQLTSLPAPTLATLAATSHDSKSRRFTPCRGRLYHQLLCSHRIRTDVVEDCGPNCLDPQDTISNLPFYCHACVEQQAHRIRQEREDQHNASYPPLEKMTQEQYAQWYEEHRQLEAQYLKDHRSYELGLRTTTRPSNPWSPAQTRREELEFAAKMESLSLAMMPSHNSTIDKSAIRTIRYSLPSDASEQLHWGLNSLSLDRSTCGIEYSMRHSSNNIPTLRGLSEDELWRRPRNHRQPDPA